MRLRHTHKTDPDMVGERAQMCYRLSGFYRERIKEVVPPGRPDLHIPGIDSESALMQDAIWLWFHEYDLLVEKGLISNGSRPERAGTGSPGHRVHAVPDQDREDQELAVGEAASAG